jgi:hypothetical protein
MLKFGYVSAQVSVRGAGSPLVVAVVEGVVTPKTAQSIIADAARWGEDRMAQVVRYDAARVELSADQLLAAALRARASDVPAAFVVQPDQLRLFRQYAQMNLDRGVMKAAFTRVEDAESWAVDQMRVRAHWQRLERALRSAP